MPENEDLPKEIENEKESFDQIGYTYILVRSNNSNIIKIGYTSVSSQSRAYNYTDGEWEVHKHYQMPIWLARLTEKASHKILKEHWLDPKITGGTASEIFTCTIEVAENAVQNAYKEQLRLALLSLKISPKICDYILYNNSLAETSELATSITELGSRNESLLNEIDILKQIIKKKDKEIASLHEVKSYYRAESDGYRKELEKISDRIETINSFDSYFDKIEKKIKQRVKTQLDANVLAFGESNSEIPANAFFIIKQNIEELNKSLSIQKWTKLPKRKDLDKVVYEHLSNKIEWFGSFITIYDLSY